MPHDPKALQAILAKAAPPDLELAFRAMFGGVMAYAGGKPFASLSDVGLALKLLPADQTALLALPGAERLRYAQGQPASKTYIVVPEPMLEDGDALRGWIARSVEGQTKAKRKS